MRTPRTLLLLLSAAALPAALSAAPPLFSSGPPPDEASNPPVYDNCSSCHTSFVTNSGSGDVNLSGIPTRYTPGTTYPITVTVDDPNASRWGFEATAMTKDGVQAGDVVVTDTANTQIVTASGDEFIEHTTQGTQNGTTVSASWSFDWVAPAAGVGEPVTFYVSGNGANGNFFNNGDQIYNDAVSTVEDAAGVLEIVARAQPDKTFPSQGSTWNVPVRITNTTAGSRTVLAVSRIRLPNGNVYPPTGWLGGPTQVTVGAGATETVLFSHAVPSNAPLITADYEVLVGEQPGPVLLDSCTFTFTVTP